MDGWRSSGGDQDSRQAAVQFKRPKSHIDHANFKKAPNNVLSLIKKKKKTCVVGKLNENTGKMEKPKSLALPSKQDKPSKICLKQDGEHCFDDKIHLNIFLNFFSNFAKELVNKLPNPPCKQGQSQQGMLGVGAPPPRV